MYFPGAEVDRKQWDRHHFGIFQADHAEQGGLVTGQRAPDRGSGPCPERLGGEHSR
jgi:hypothetical protein